MPKYQRQITISDFFKDWTHNFASTAEFAEEFILKAHELVMRYNEHDSLKAKAALCDEAIANLTAWLREGILCIIFLGAIYALSVAP